MPVGRSLVISGPTFPVCERPKSAGSSEESCVHKTQKCLQLGFRVRCPPTSLPSVLTPCAATQRSTCLGLRYVCLPIGLIPARGNSVFSSYSHNEVHLVGIHCAPWLNGGWSVVHLTLSYNLHCGEARSPGRALPPCEAISCLCVIFRYFI